VAIVMRQLPARKRVGREALVNQAERAGNIGIGQLAIEILDLGREQKALVNDGPRGKRREVEELFVFDVGIGDFLLSAFAHHVQLALERTLVHLRRTSNEYLLNVWLRSTGDAADRVTVHRRITPAKNRESF